MGARVTEGEEREDANAAAAKTSDEREVSAVALHLEKCRPSIHVSPGGTRVQFWVNVQFSAGTGVDWDLSAIFLGPDGRMWAEDSLVCSCRPEDSRPAAVWLGGNQRSPNSYFEVDLPRVDSRTRSILAVVTVFQENAPGDLGEIGTIVASVRDARTGKELCEFLPTEDARGHSVWAIGALRRRGFGWEFVALSEYFGNGANGLEDVLRRYSPSNGD